MTKKVKNIPESVKQKLRNLAHKRNEDVKYLFLRYGMERFLFRLGLSPHNTALVLKGGNLLPLWLKEGHRSTLDLDFLSFGEPSAQRYQVLFQELFSLKVEDDGLHFESSSIRTENIREEAEYHGIRVKFFGMLGESPIHLQVDLSFGDVVTPPPTSLFYPALLSEFSRPFIFVSSKETCVAEKLQAMVYLGLSNTRIKDFFDLDRLSSQCEFDGPSLLGAVQQTFQRRKTGFPVERPPSLTDAFFERGQALWKPFLSRHGLQSEDFSDVLERLQAFLFPLLEAAKQQFPPPSWAFHWLPKGPWKPRERDVSSGLDTFDEKEPS